MSEFKSCARWPDDCCPAIGNYSDDTHGSFEAADAVIGRLLRDGFGGDRQFFPVAVWVEKKIDGVWTRVDCDTTCENCKHWTRLNRVTPGGKCAVIANNPHFGHASTHAIKHETATCEHFSDKSKCGLIETDYEDIARRANEFAESLTAGWPKDAVKTGRILPLITENQKPPAFIKYSHTETGRLSPPDTDPMAGLPVKEVCLLPGKDADGKPVTVQLNKDTVEKIKEAAVEHQKKLDAARLQGNALRLVDADHPALHTVSTEVAEEDIPYVLELRRPAQRFMRRHKGCGLAANQVGDTRRWFVWEYGMVINPRIKRRGTMTQIGVEGCLSFPGNRVSVNRHKTIDVEYIDDRGVKVERTLEGFTAVVFQHETDHLNGICIVDGKSSANIVEADRRRNSPSARVAALFGMAAALGVTMPQHREQEPREKTADDLDRLEAARLKRERKEQKRKTT